VGSARPEEQAQRATDRKPVSIPLAYRKSRDKATKNEPHRGACTLLAILSRSKSDPPSLEPPDRPSSVLQGRMSDRRDDLPAESPIQRALRMRKAAMAAKPKPPRSEGADRKPASGIAAGASKPWMKK